MELVLNNLLMVDMPLNETKIKRTHAIINRWQTFIASDDHNMENVGENILFQRCYR